MVSKADRQKNRELSAEHTLSMVVQGKVLSIYQDIISYPSGEKSTYDLVRHPGAVAILPIDTTGELLLIRQWRRSVQEILIELPAGTIDPGEEPAACAAREVREETGFQAGSLVPLGGFYTAPGFCNEYIHLFLATDLSYAPLIAEDTEDIDLFPLSLKEALLFVVQGKIRDSKTIAALLLYQAYLQK